MTGKNVAGDAIFANRRILSPSYVPDARLVDREEELANIEYALNPMIFGREPDDSLIHGPVGTGKTMCARYSARRQVKYASEQGVAAGCAYVDCLETATEVKVTRAIATQLNDRSETGVDIPASGLSTDEYHARLRRILADRYDAVVLVFDRVDYLATDRLPLSRWEPGDDGRSSCTLTAIGIVDGSIQSATLEEGIRQSLAEHEHEFEPYDVDHLVEILEQRRDAFADRVLEAGVITHTAELAVDPVGDAGRAIAILRRAGELARDRGVGTVGTALIEEAAETVESFRTRETLGALPTHSRLVLLALASLTLGRDGDTFRTTRIYDAYVEHCRDRDERPRSERRVQHFLNEHATVGFTEQTPHWGGRAEGNYNTHRLLTPPETVYRALGEPPDPSSAPLHGK